MDESVSDIIRMSQKPPPTVVSVLNLKGGVGKTTVTALLARYAASNGHKVLAVDLDPQANLSQALMGEEPYIEFMGDLNATPPKLASPSIVELFKNRRPPSSDHPSPTPLQTSDVVQYVMPNLDIIPSRFDFADNLIDSVKIDEEILANFICNEAQDNDLVLIDCAPTESILTRAAYHASRYVLIPVKPELFSTIGFPLMKKSLDEFCRKNPTHKIEVCGVLINRNDYSSQDNIHADDSFEDIQTKAGTYNWNVFSKHMTHSSGYPKMVVAGSFPRGNSNSLVEWPPIAKDILKAINLSY